MRGPAPRQGDCVPLHPLPNSNLFLSNTIRISIFGEWISYQPMLIFMSSMENDRAKLDRHGLDRLCARQRGIAPSALPIFEWMSGLWNHRHINLALTRFSLYVSFLARLLLSHWHIFQEERCHEGGNAEQEDCQEPVLERNGE